MPQGLYLSQKMALAQVLAPQLQQSLALLQAPTMELQALVQQEMQQNPVLEEVPDTDLQDEKPERVDAEGDAPPASADLAEPPADTQFDPATEKASSEPVDEFQAEFEKLQQLDQDWRDNFAATSTPTRSTQEDEEKREFMFNSLVSQTSLQENLLGQVRLSELNNGQISIAELIIGNIDDYGYLKVAVEELSLSTNVEPEKIESVLKVIQNFHPPGVGARDLRECLLLQLERKRQTHTLEYKIIDQCFDALSKRRIPEIARVLDRDIDDIQDALQRIALLDPRPGREFLPDNDIYVVPEVFVIKGDDGEFLVTTNNDHIPHLRISNHYKDLMTQAESNSEVRNYIREKIRAGKFLIKSLHQRQSTLLNIGREIVHRQREFMEKGSAFLKPLTMVQVAEVVGVHETTVSRAVAGKYMQTPQGLYEMKYFFTSGLQTADGASMANTSVKEMIEEIFKKEDGTKPLSDQEVVKMLTEKGISIARRTVAKYRGELGILPSNLRRVY
ncbi:MAG TPA: RNA polymerase factor sigma-54 [Candidatus Acidoferrum sp.]|nr:RNA polymerase factor sigma-54 [Candidatus Acidoferrum sp.]